MKVYISGTKYFVPGTWREGVPPETFATAIDEIVEKGEEIIVCDFYGVDTVVQEYLQDKEYKNVTIYVVGKKTRKNVGNWKEKHIIPSDNATKFRYCVDRELSIVENADYGIIAWNGCDRESYVDMINLVYLGKKCRLYLMEEDKWIDICTLEELENFAGEQGKIEEEDIKSILEICGFSEEMKEFLVGNEAVNDYQLVEIIYNAPIGLRTKISLLMDLWRKRNQNREFFDLAIQYRDKGYDFKKLKKAFRNLSAAPAENCVWRRIQEMKEDMDTAFRYLFENNAGWGLGSVYSLFSEWYDTEVFMEKAYNLGIFSAQRYAFDYIENEEQEIREDCNGDVENPGWYRIEYWEQKDRWEQEDQQVEQRYDYFIYGGDACWYEEKVAEKQDNGNIYYMKKHSDNLVGELDLNLRTPFKTGDIVLIDCRPFGPPFHAVILESQNQFDCCFPNIVFNIPYTNDWRCTPIKHKRFYKDVEWGSYCPKLSPLYRLRTILPNEMTAEDEALLTIKALLSGNEETAKEVWKLWGCEDKTYEEVIEVISSVGERPREKEVGDQDGNNK